MTNVSIENGKYTFQVTQGRIDILRFGKPWVVDLQCAGSKAIMGLIFEVEELEEENAKLRVVAEAAKKLKVITPEEAVEGKPYWIVPCDSYEPLKIAMDELEEVKE